MAWAKLYTDILGDPKLMRAARKGLKGLEYLPWLIAFAKGAADDGRLSVGGEPAETADIAELIPGATRRNIAECLKTLEKIGILSRDFDQNGDDFDEKARGNGEKSSKSDSFLRFSAWERRSGVKPSDSSAAISERVQRHRQKAKDAQSQALPAVTPPTLSAPGSERNALHGALRNATEEKREEEKREDTESVTRAAHVEPQPVFLMAWSVYPRRAGSNPRRAAAKAWTARMREGVDEHDMFAGTERYRAYCEGRAIVGSDYVMQGQRFYGPNREYENGWEASPGKVDSLETRALAIVHEDAEREQADTLWLATRGVS